MQGLTVRTLFRYAFWIYSAVSMSFGLLMLVTGYQNLQDPDTAGDAYRLIIFSSTFLVLPVTIFFTVKAVKSYHGMNTKYGLPDSPTRPFILVAASIFLVMCIIITIAIYLVVVRSSY